MFFIGEQYDIISYMEKLSKKIIILSFLILFLCPAFIFSNDANIEEKNDIKVYTLSNGLTLYTKEDKTSALTRIELAVRAGFSSQSPSNAGFFPLYTRLFLTPAIQQDPSFDTQTVASYCNADSATYTTELSPYNTEHYLHLLSLCCINPSFPEEILNEQLNAMKIEVLQYEDSTAGFLNSAIDSRVFYEEPWKQDSGIYPSLFSSNTTSSARTKLLEISSNYYIPQNTALFISGNIDSEKICFWVEKYFSKWQAGKILEKSPVKIQKNEESKKYVITDPAFSDEMTQIVVQYTGLSLGASSILAAAFSNQFSTYKKEALNNNILSIRDSDYINAASAQKNGSSRLILQAIMEEPYLFASQKPKKGTKIPSPLEQAELFVKTASSCAMLNDKDFYSAQNLILAQYRSIKGNTSEYMKLLADYWSLTSKEKNFCASTENLFNEIENLKIEELKKMFSEDTPYIFVLVNSEIYKKNKKSFDKEKYNLITRENASWYSDQLKLKSAMNTDFTKSQNENSDDEEKTFESKSQNYYLQNASMYLSSTLKNNIPLVIKKNADSQEALLSIAITGGELASPSNEKHLRTVLINAFATNIQKEISFMCNASSFTGETQVKAWTEDTVSYITISCIKEDLHQVLLAASNAIVFGEVPPALADQLVYDEKNQWSVKSSSLVYQMNCAAFSSIYNGTKYQKLFDTNANILKDTSFTSVSKAYTELLDSSLYTLLVTGDIEFDNVIKEAEETFGKLKEQTKRSEAYQIQPVFSRLTRKVKLRHTYTTDIPKELAGERPLILIPTTDFYDPVEFYFKAPVQKDEIALFNALLYELNYQLQKKVDTKINCSIKEATWNFPVAAVIAEKVLYTKNFDVAYKAAVNKVFEELNTLDTSALLRIKSLWISQVMSPTGTNEGTATLIQKGILSGNPLQYLEDYVTVDTCTFEDLLKIADTYLLKEPMIKLYSKDAK